MMAGGIAGLSSWVIGYPIDYLKTKIQSQDLDNKEYRGMLNCFWKHFRQHGMGGFTKGLWTVCLRAFPVNTVGFLAEDEVAYLMGRREIE